MTKFKICIIKALAALSGAWSGYVLQGGSIINYIYYQFQYPWQK